ncbi:MAG: hypothetical protein AMJ62_09390 [Myxococcales bacterium SG8_38]|nr:MAG: hypothetical protein AMJ62_09390 [Myxococcales bacterium SG8_38]
MRYLLHFGLFALTLITVAQADAQGRHQPDRHASVVRLEPARGVYHPRHQLAPYDRDAREIISIAAHWKQATANRDRRGQWVADRRLDAWLDREIRESVRHPYNQRYVMHLRALNDELIALERHPHRGHGRHGYYARKVRILDELVELSKWQTERARHRGRHSIQMSFAYR